MNKPTRECNENKLKFIMGILINPFHMNNNFYHKAAHLTIISYMLFLVQTEENLIPINLKKPKMNLVSHIWFYSFAPHVEDSPVYNNQDETVI